MAERLSSPRAFFNYGWITLVVMIAIVLVGLIVFLLVRPWRTVSAHVHDELEPTGAELHQHEPQP